MLAVKMAGCQYQESQTAVGMLASKQNVARYQDSQTPVTLVNVARSASPRFPLPMLGVKTGRQLSLDVARRP